MTKKEVQTQAIEDYLKAIYEVEQRDGKVSTSALAGHLDVAPASATGMVKKLAALKLIRHERYQGAVLTPAGEQIALEVLRHHRLIETYLVEAMGMSWDQVHDEAERWEHVISEEVEDRMDELLGHPTHDPHGAPIPRRDGTLPNHEHQPLLSLSAGARATVAEVSDHDPELLRYLADLGLYPNTTVTVEAAPAYGPLTLRIADTAQTVGREAAQYVYVTNVQA